MSRILKNQILANAGRETPSGRVYPIETVDYIYKESVERGYLFGIFADELDADHPTEMPLERIAVRGSNFALIGNLFYADLEVLETPGGERVEQLLADGTKLRFHVYGTGVVDDDSSDITRYSLIGITVSEDK